MSANSENKPNINVTPLIDILLVLLIIFMAIAPLKPSRFEAKIPAESKDERISPNINPLIVTINSDLSLMLNQDKDSGTIAEPQNLITKLSEVFQRRLENRIYAEGMELRNDLPDEEKVLKTVFVKAPRSISYGNVAKVIDSVKLAGANPIGLQIDDLDDN